MQLRYMGVAYERTFPLMTGEVRPEGIELEYLPGTPGPIFQKVGTGEGFDASEYSCSNYIIGRARGEDRFVALPIFPSRCFRHDTVFVNVHAGIERPEDLRGKRVGVPEYSQTANYWVRAFLQHDYGVSADSIHWVRSAENIFHRSPPTGVTVTAAPEGSTLSELLDTGEIDALVSLERPRCFLKGSPNVRRLFPDVIAADADYYRRTGHFPIMHVVIVQRTVYEQNRWIARALYDAFLAAKQQSYRATDETGHYVTNFPLHVPYLEQTKVLFGDDPFPYGLAKNRHTVGALAKYVYEQGAAERVVPLEDLFVPELLDT
jgi:4,5-dihydroxyphthalate decarboxylase